MQSRHKAAVLAAVFASAGAFADDTRTVEVNCGGNKSINDVLASSSVDKKRLEIVVRGTCTESVRIDRDDVTVRADAGGGGIHGPDANTNTVLVTGGRVTLEGLTISGGRSGVVGQGASNLTVRNATVQSTGRNGIVYLGGSSGTIDHCVLQSNPRDGVSVDTATITIINSDIVKNGRFGVLLAIGASARIGVNTRNEAARNTITLNGNTGINLGTGAMALIAANQITNNGGQGIAVFEAKVELAGMNVITGNAFQGIFARGSTVQIGGPDLGFSTTNTITGNGTATPAGGVFLFLGSSALVRNAVISNNSGVGLGLSLRSQGQLFGSTIQNNTGDGINLQLGSALLPALPTATVPATTVSGNSGWGIQCFGAESSIANAFDLPPPAVSAFSFLTGNGPGNISPGCTDFF